MNQRKTVTMIAAILALMILAGCPPSSTQPPVVEIPPMCIRGHLRAEICKCIAVSEAKEGLACCKDEIDGIEVPIRVYTERGHQLPLTAENSPVAPSAGSTTADYVAEGEDFCIDVPTKVPEGTISLDVVISEGWAEETDGVFGEPCYSARRTVSIDELTTNTSCSQNAEDCLDLGDIALVCRESKFTCLYDYRYVPQVCGYESDQVCKDGFDTVQEICQENVELQP